MPTKKSAVKPESVPTVKMAAAVNLKPAIEIIKEFEGFRTNAYLCPAKVWTIGYGTTKGVKPGQKITREAAEALLVTEVVQKYLPAVYKIKVPLTNNQICALVSWLYNVGTGPITTSTLAKKLNAGAPKAEVAAEFHKWNKGGGKVLAGLVRRRKMEAALFLKA